MIDVLLRDGDLVASKYGDISLCEDESEDVIQTANNNILLRYGDNKFHSELGNKVYSRRKKANENGMEIIKSECIDAINSDSRIREIKQINVTLLDDASCSIDYTLIYAKTIEDVEVDEDIIPEDEDMDVVDILETYDEPDEILVEVDGRAYINAFNIKGGE